MNKQHLTKRLSGFGQSFVDVSLVTGLQDLTDAPWQVFSHCDERLKREPLAPFGDKILSRCEQKPKLRGTKKW